MKGKIIAVQTIHGSPFVQIDIEPEELNIKGPRPITHNDSERVTAQFMEAIEQYAPKMMPFSSTLRPRTILVLTVDEYQNYGSPTVGQTVEFDFKVERHT